jgi:large subunit ribosomal protein L13
VLRPGSVCSRFFPDRLLTDSAKPSGSGRVRSPQEGKRRSQPNSVVWQWVEFRSHAALHGVTRFARLFLRPERVGREVFEGRREMSTFVPSGKNIDRKWYVIDAEGQTLGRLATKAASVLSGKLNPKYVPYIDMGDHVIVINAEKVRLTGLKTQTKVYRRYTGFPGGLREESFTRLLARKPEKILEEAIKGMLPKSKLGRAMGSKLKVYRGDKHPHQSQTPVAMPVA